MLNESRKSTKFIRTLYGDKANVFTFCIATSDNPRAKQLPEEENAKRRKELESFLKQNRLHYYRIGGSYGAPEHSYLIANINVDMCKHLFGKDKFDQESFIFGVVNPEEKKTTFILYMIDENGKFEVKEESTKIINADSFDDFFSQFEQHKFSIPFKTFMEAIENISTELEEAYGWNPKYVDYLMESAFSEGYTLKHYWMYNCSHLLTQEQEEDRVKRLDSLQEDIKRLAGIL